MADREDGFDYPKAFERGTALRRMRERDLEAQLEADEHRSDPQVDVGLNDLHSGIGQVCPVCGRPIREGQPTRKTITGRYQHDAC